MKRRDFITLLSGTAAAWPLAARAQQTRKVWRVGFLSGSSRASMPVLSGFTQGMRELGYVENQDLFIEWRFAEGKYDRFPDFMAELVRLKVDAIVLGTPAAIRPAQQATSAIPIVIGYSVDPVKNGFVASLSRPGGNTTGLASSLEDSSTKQIELLATSVPKLSSVGLLMNPGTPTASAVLSNAQASARKAGLETIPVEARSAEEIENAVSTLTNKRVGAVMVIPDALFFAERKRIAERTLQMLLPTVFAQREYVEAGGLMSYGENLKDFFRRAASFVDKIFKGAKPGDLPIEQPTRFYLVVNLKTAKALGLTISESFLLRADEVIE